MSTKNSLQWREQTDVAPGYHLYEDCFETLDDADAPVYLRMDGVPVNLATQVGGLATVTVEMPREMARALGLLPNAK